MLASVCCVLSVKRVSISVCLSICLFVYLYVFISACLYVCLSVHLYMLKAKAKASDSYIARLTGKPDQPCFTIIEVAVDWQEPMVLRH